MNDKIFEKINVKIVISIKHCTAVQNFGQYKTSDFGTKFGQQSMTKIRRSRSLVVSNLRLETKSFRFESGC